MKDLDLLVLADRQSSVCRAYLRWLKHYGYKPKKILIIDQIGSSKITRQANDLLGRRVASLLLRLYRNIRKLYLNEDKGWIKLAKSMDARFKSSVSLFGDFNYTDYAHETETVIAKGFDDPGLLEAVTHSGIKALLFTGGGRVKPELLALPDVKVIHIHPGIVPDIKGADGILWSTLLRGKLGYSGFYMTPEIDEGDVLIREEYELPGFDRHVYFRPENKEAMYKALLFSFDAHMRAKTLMTLIKKSKELNCELDEIPGEAQTEGNGRVFFFMHERLRNAALERLCK